jgi:hypothetical protein
MMHGRKSIKLLSRNVVFFIEHNKVDRTQEHRLLYWTRTGRQSTEISHTSLNTREWAESKTFWLFTEKKTVGRPPKICDFPAEDCGQGPETSIHLSNTRRSAEVIFFTELETVHRFQKLPSLYSTRRNFESFIEHETVVRVQKHGVLYWTENDGPCTGNVTSYDSS